MIYQLRQEVNYLKEMITGAAPVHQLPQQSSAARQTAVPEFDVSGEGTAGGPGTVSVEPVIGAMSYQRGPHPQERNAAEYYTQTDEPDEQENADLSLQSAGEVLIRKALEKHRGNRKLAAAELGISERTLYRKLKEFDK